MEFGGEMQGSPSPGNRPKGDPNRELGSRNQVSMGPTSKTPLTHSCRFVRNGAIMLCLRPEINACSAGGWNGQGGKEARQRCSPDPRHCLQCTIPCRTTTVSGDEMQRFSGGADMDVLAGVIHLTNSSFTKLGMEWNLPSPWNLDINRTEAWVNVRSGADVTAETSAFGTQAHPLHRRCIVVDGSRTRLQFTATSLVKCNVEWETAGQAKIGALNSSFTPRLKVATYQCQDKTRAGCDKDAQCEEVHDGGVCCKCPPTANELKPYGQQCRQRTTADFFLQERDVRVIIRKPRQVRSAIDFARSMIVL